MDIKVIDNFLPEVLFDNICSMIYGNRIRWSLLSDTTRKNDGNISLSNQFYKHDNQEDSTFPEFLQENKLLVELLPNFHYLYRCKVNCFFKTENNIPFPFHTDLYFKEKLPPKQDETVMTGVLHLNTNNGGTQIKDGQFVPSVENRFVYFKNSVEHATVTQTDEPLRYVLNINWQMKWRRFYE